MGTSPTESSIMYGSTPQSLPNFQHPSHALLKENNFTQTAYHKWHSKCLKGTRPNTIESWVRKAATVILSKRTCGGNFRRTNETGYRSNARNEYVVPFLVFLPSRQFQPQNVRRVSNVGRRRREIRLQVREARREWRARALCQRRSSVRIYVLTNENVPFCAQIRFRVLMQVL